MSDNLLEKKKIGNKKIIISFSNCIETFSTNK